MGQLKSVWGQFLGYSAWILTVGSLGVFLGDRKLPTDYAQTVGVIMIVSIGYFLFQVGLFHAKLNRIEGRLKIADANICRQCEKTTTQCSEGKFPSCCSGCSHKF